MCQMKQVFMDITCPGDYEAIPDVPQVVYQSCPQHIVLGKTNAEVVRVITLFNRFEYRSIGSNGEYSSNMASPCIMQNGWGRGDQAFIREGIFRDPREGVCYRIVLPMDVNNTHLVL